ncbi:MAG TPA: competence/damage-inducible protein A [Solirubrobacteraceae bacterium]|jgi:nicotinamide-nucleotide amidase|nr:competence/damage-inducible protein A [Solirubrobacteraceae bacterium]
MNPPHRRARAGIVVTGTEVLNGRVRDRNGPWLSERLFEQGVDLAHILIVGDRPADMEAALGFMASEGMDVVMTSGGLGPTADDLTAAVVGRFQGRELVLDEPLEGRIAEILAPLAARYPNLDREAIAEGNRKQATIPQGATVLEPVGTAPGLVVAPAEGRRGPTVVVLPGPPRELQPMWRQAISTRAWRDAVAAARDYRQRMLRLFGIPESEIAETLREAERGGVGLDALEITTCLRGGEIEIVTRYEPDAQDAYDAFAAIVAERHADTLYSQDGTTVDDQVAALLRGQTLGDGGATGRETIDGGAAASKPVGAAGRRTIAVAESCTGGLLAARLTNPPGASEYVLGGIVAYSNDAKVEQVGVSAESIERHGAVSELLARELAAGARSKLAADVGVGLTGIAGPSGGSEEKPVGLVWLSVQGPEGAALTRSVRLPGGRADVRERAVTVAMHMIRRLLQGESDGARAEKREGAGPLLR